MTSLTGADLGFIKRGAITQGTNLLGRGMQSTLPSKSMLELEGPGGMPPPQEILEKNTAIWRHSHIKFIIFSACRLYILRLDYRYGSLKHFGKVWVGTDNQVHDAPSHNCTTLNRCMLE